MPLIEANHTRLWVERHGHPARPPVLLLHGLFFSGQMYDRLLPALTTRFHCVTIDGRSMGRSARALGGHDVDNLCADMMAVQDALQLGPAHWVGSSVGGVIGLRVAAQWPERVLSLVTCGASAHAEPLDKLNRYESLLASYASDPASAWPRLAPVLYGPDFLNNPARAADRHAQFQAFIDNDGPSIQRAAAPILRRVGIEHMLAHVRCPTLAIVGEHDGANPPEHSRHIVAGIDGARLHVMPGVGHQPNAEAPVQLGHTIAAFLQAAPMVS
ncbi:MAG: alpha/beta fold hydrolase [Hydrogenophaga sp.]|uniref:alpha/beta fold hydrolase n=1 Tax=Hydrogenophaga sp. TaxID=1904254 RepID=UPI0026145A7A|nr:alpha/beta fold hydrolase [Hydrogenophaga sp.]MDD3786903.1 alpha/beta fold hydrolase [Hydrogenophaga sp.]